MLVRLEKKEPLPQTSRIVRELGDYGWLTSGEICEKMGWDTKNSIRLGIQLNRDGLCRVFIKEKGSKISVWWVGGKTVASCGSLPPGVNPYTIRAERGIGVA